MNKYLSSKIKMVSLISIIMVVFLHCYTLTDNFLGATTIITEGLNYDTFIEYFICNGFTRFAVPIFFMISGYLFYLTFKLSIESYLYKIKSRFMSLAVPYILWSAIAMIICYLLWGMDIMPVNDMKGNLEAGGFWQVLRYPPNFQFWFVKELICYVIVSPIIYLVIKFRITRVIYLLCLFAMWFTDVNPFSFVVMEALFFYSIGSYLAITNKMEIIMKKVSKNIVISSGIMWILLLTVKTVLCGISKQGDPITAILALYKITVLLGIFTVWYGMDYVIANENTKNKLLSLSCHTFFIFCFHEPLLDFVIQYTLRYIGSVSSLHLITYLAYPSVTIVLAILVSKILLRYVPTLHNILTGSRGTIEKYATVEAVEG